MLSLFSKTCEAYDISPDLLIKKHTCAEIRTIRIMLWTILVRELHITVATIAAKFQCSRRNIFWAIKNLEGNMEFNSALRAAFSRFKSKIFTN